MTTTCTPKRDPETATKPQSAPARRTLGEAWHERIEGLHVLRVAGSFYEMGFQHGALLADAVATGPLFYYRTYLEKLVRNAGLGKLAGTIRRLVAATIGREVARGIPKFAREALRGLADGAGLPYRDVLEGATMPDTLLWVVARLIELRRVEPAVRHRVALSLGCTSAIAWGEASASNRLLHARNFDYHGVSCWPRSQAVIFHVPERGMRYVSVAAAGIPLGGKTAMNEAGLSLVVHQHMFSNGTRLGGTTIGTVGDIVMRHAGDLEEAERILRRHRPTGCWTYLIADAKRQEVLCFEENPRRQVAIRVPASRTSFGYTNIYLDPELGATERNLYPSYWRHNQGRFERVRDRLAENHGAHTPRTMAGILADTGASGCRIRDSIAMLMTVASVVFRPEDGALWVASGEAPTSHGRFVPFSLANERHAPDLGAFTDHVPASAAERAAFAHYRDAYVALVDEEDPTKARRLLEAALEADPRQPLYRFVAGLLALRTGDWRAARERFAAALELGHPDPERCASFELWFARSLDLLGERAHALERYRAVLGRERVDPNVRRAARRGLRRPFREHRARRVAIEFSFADVIRP